MLINLDLQSHRALLGDEFRKSLNGYSARPAVVVGDSVNALGVARSLAMERVPVILLSSNPHSFVYRSRSIVMGLVCEDVDSPRLAYYLELLGSVCPVKPALFLTHDDQVDTVSANRDSLSQLFAFRFPKHELVSWLLSKSGFHDIATRHTLPVPSTHYVRTSGDLILLRDKVRPKQTWIAKPDHKSDSFEARFGKAVAINSLAEWEDFESYYAAHPEPVIFQHKLSGPDTNVLFCLVVFHENSDCIASFTGAKIRQFKPVLGSTASAMPESNEHIREMSVDFFKAIGFSGMGSLEFKLNDVDGLYYAIEPTVGRTDLQSELAPLNGCNLTSTYYKSLFQPAHFLIAATHAKPKSRVPITWIRLPADFRASIHYFRVGQLSIGAWFGPYFGRIAPAVFRFTDPSPFCRLIMNRSVSILKSAAYRLFRHVVR